MKLRITAIFLICAILAGALFSCGGEDAGTDINKNPAADAGNENGGNISETPAESDSYIYPELDCGGGDFTIMNMSTPTWGFYTDLVQEAMTGEVLDDAIYTRNRALENQFNVNIKEVSVDVADNPSQRFRTAVMAGEDIYDAAYIPCNANSVPIGTLITANMLHNLNDIPTLNLDQSWWNQSIKQDSAIGSSKSLFFAFSDMNIMPLQCAYVIYINEDIMKNRGLELPYALAKEGKWTYDELYKYMRAGAQLNGGADAFKWEDAGPAVYGLTSFEGGVLALLTASGERGVAIGGDGMPYMTFESERFYNVVDKLSELLGTETQGEYLYANTYPGLFHFEVIFRNSRAMMMGGELKASDSFRDMDDTFGILPTPKYDEAQSQYYTPMTVQVPALVIPTTNNNTERAGIILDAMAYLSAKDITPVFFDITMSQKRLRNEESIEMLQIIRDSLLFDIGSAYGWTDNILYSIRDSLNSGGSGNAASTVERQIARSQANIDKTMELMEE